MNRDTNISLDDFLYQHDLSKLSKLWISKNPEFQHILIPEYEAIDSILFWSDIMRDHMLFIYLFLVDRENNQAQEYKQIASNLYERWGRYINYFKSIINENIDLNSDENLNELKSLFAVTGDLKRQLLDQIINHNWEGFLFKSYLYDNITELGYFITYLKGGVNPLTEIEFLNEHAKGHAMLDSKFIDPQSAQQWVNALKTGLKFDNLSNYNDWKMKNYNHTIISFIDETIKLNQEYLNNLGQLELDSKSLNKFQSIIIPELLTHTMKEISYSIVRIQKIKAMYPQLMQ